MLVHLMSEVRVDCHICNEKECIKKIPSSTLPRLKKSEKSKLGSVVKEFIESAKQEVESEKKSLKEVEYK